MILYAQTKKVTISSGTIPTKGVTSNLPFQVEDIIRESNIQHSKDNKKYYSNVWHPLQKKVGRIFHKENPASIRENSCRVIKVY